MELSHLIIVLILLGCMATYIPVFMCLFFTSVLGFVFFTDLPVLLLAQSLFRSMDNFALVVVLFFILCGNIMTAGSMVEKLIKVANVLVSWLPGGLGMAGVLACGLFGAISGSTVATVVALGGFMIPALMDNGYPQKYTLGLMTTSPNLGVIIPPSIGMILFSMISNVSLEGLFLTGFLPGVLIMLGVCLYSYFFFRKKTEIVRMPVPKPMEVLAVLKEGFWSLMLIVIIFGGIFSGAFTANEVAVVACVYAFIVELFIHKSMKFSAVKKITANSAVTSAHFADHCGRGYLLRPIAYIGRYSGENYRSGFNHGSFSLYVPVGHEHSASFCRHVYGYHFGHHDFRTGISSDAGCFRCQLDAFWLDHDGQPGHWILHPSHGGQSLHNRFDIQQRYYLYLQSRHTLFTYPGCRAGADHVFA